MSIQTHNGIFVLLAVISRAKSQQLFHIKRGKAIQLHRTYVTTRSLDPEHLDGLSSEGSFIGIFAEVLPPPKFVTSCRLQKVGAIEQ